MLIIDMPMPKYCADCPMIALSDRGMICLCTEALLEIDYDKKRPSWCPIIGELPEQHGRIIDEAVFCENVVKYSHQSTKTIGKALDATPTIIEMTPIVTERKDDDKDD